jgi:hypothetical protein
MSLDPFSAWASLRACLKPSVPLHAEQALASVRLRASVEASAHSRAEPEVWVQLRAEAEPLAQTRALPSEQPRAWAEPSARHVEFVLWARLGALA